MPDPTTTTMTTTLPTIHLNGTGAQNLEEEYRAVRRAVSAAGDALQAATCNARDFYPQDPGAWQRARAERDEARHGCASIWRQQGRPCATQPSK
jgi:hypothetical protein